MFEDELGWTLIFLFLLSVESTASSNAIQNYDFVQPKIGSLGIQKSLLLSLSVNSQ